LGHDGPRQTREVVRHLQDPIASLPKAGQQPWSLAGAVLQKKLPTRAQDLPALLNDGLQGFCTA
jgi:hypothetical protein